MKMPATDGRYAVLLTAVASLLVWSCGGGGGGGYPTQAQPPAGSVQTVSCASVTASAAVAAVGATAFAPSAVTINANQVVQWNNSSGFLHTVTSTSVPANGTFDVPLGNGASVCLRFTEAGTFQYRCTFHPVMTGSVIVN